MGILVVAHVNLLCFSVCADVWSLVWTPLSPINKYTYTSQKSAHASFEENDDYILIIITCL